MNTKIRRRALLIATTSILMIAASTRLQASQTGTCGGQMTTIPFDDVLPGNVFFCSIAEAFFTGLTNGTDGTHYSPTANVTREQMAAFITRTMDQSVKRSVKRAALNQYWTTHGANNLAFTAVGTQPQLVQSDGADIWVANNVSNTVSRVRASDGKLLGTWTGATGAFGVLCAMGKVFVTGTTSPGNLYQIDPTQPPGAVTTYAAILGNNPLGIAYDGQRIWTANFDGSVSIVTFNPTSVTGVSTGFTALRGIIYDGANIWVTDDTSGVDALRKLDSSGNILLSVGVQSAPQFPAFDGMNIWVPNALSDTISVVRATGGLAGTVLATLGANPISAPVATPVSAAFDGERIIVTNLDDNSVSLWNATDITPIGTFTTGRVYGACSDGLNFWIALIGSGNLARF